MSKADEILSILGQMEVLILKAKEIAGTPPDAPVARQAAPPARSTPSKAPRPSPAVQKVQAAFQAGGEYPAVGTMLDLPEPVSIAHKDGPLEGVAKVKTTFPGHAQPEIGGKANPRPFFSPAKQPEWWWAKFGQYEGWTWAKLFAEPYGAGLDAILADKFWTVSTFKDKRYPSKLWQQAMALKVLRGEREPGADEGVGSTWGEEDPRQEEF